jgi:hypothetical protein
MFRFDEGLKVLLHRDAVDGRKGINGLAALVEHALGLDPFGPTVYAFTNGSSAESVGELVCAPSQVKLDSDTDRASDKLHQRHFVRTLRSLAR